ncbi:MAG: spore cortex biosynthesis protein YabQ [Lachnospiraceae bacterium]|nr:spore cortex biosynthesis protein YabQ [Lachnospiraceae bacterium]
MNQDIAGDVRFFLAAVLLGAVAALVYDLLRVWRRFHEQTLFIVSVQDFIYWFLLGIAGFRMIYHYNAGTLRFFAFGGICLGAGIYMATIGRFFVKYCLKLLLFLTFPLRKGLLFLRKKGKLIKKMRKRFQKEKMHGRKDTLATEKQKKKNRFKASSAGGADNVRSADLQQREGRGA